MTRVKICGITNLRDALAVSSSGADYLGFIVGVPVETPRKITLQQAEAILQETGRSKAIIVTMPSTLKDVERVIELKPFAIQLHGNEQQEFVKNMRDITSKTRIIKTLHVKKTTTFEDVKNEAEAYSTLVDCLLLDTQTDKTGGTGVTHDWRVSAQLVEAVDRPVFLSGGINPGNVRRAIEEVRPYCVDASSGLEYRPGFKDHDMVGRFVGEVRACST